MTARSVWSLCKIACVRGVCEILVGWWSRTDQVRTHGSGSSIHFMNQRWKCSPVSFAFQDHLDKAIELKPHDPLSYYLLGRWCYAVCDPADAHICPSVLTQTKTGNLWRADTSAWPPVSNPPTVSPYSCHCFAFPDGCFHASGKFVWYRYRSLTPAVVCILSNIFLV